MVPKAKFHMTGRQVRDRGIVNLRANAGVTLDDLVALGADFHAMDSAIIGPAVSAGAIPESMLTTWIRGVIRALTSPQDIDLIAGVTTLGDWRDDNIKVRTVERFGRAERYSDGGNIPLASYNPGYEERNVVRFEQGFEVGLLERARQGAAGFEPDKEKLRSATIALDKSRNAVGMHGVLNTKTYGLLNDPNLSAVQTTTVAWATATYAQLVAEFTRLRNLLDDQMGTALRDEAQFVLVLPKGYRGIMNIENSLATRTFGGWLQTNYPNLRVEYVPGFKAASAGNVDICYLIVEGVAYLDESDVDEATLIQAVPTRFNALGVQDTIKTHIEDFTNATAGVIVLRPWAIVRSEIAPQ